MFKSTLNTIRKRKAELGVADKFLTTRNMAEEIGLGTEFVSMNKICSKLVHPTALSILGIDFPGKQSERDVLLMTGAEYLQELVSHLLAFTRESFDDPLPWPEV